MVPRLRLELEPGDALRAVCAEAADSPWILTRGADGVAELRDARAPRQRPLRIELAGAEVRRRIAQGRRGLLPRALGFRKPPWRVLDLTAGLGRDAATCAGLGMEVLAYERQPLLAALLAEAAERDAPQLRGALRIRAGSAGPAEWSSVDAVLYDPMYPTAAHGAAPSLELQRLRELVGEDADVAATFAALRAQPPARLAVKRPPRGARVELAPPDVAFDGGRVRWAVYLRPPEAH